MFCSEIRPKNRKWGVFEPQRINLATLTGLVKISAANYSASTMRTILHLLHLAEYTLFREIFTVAPFVFSVHYCESVALLAVFDMEYPVPAHG